MNKETKIFIDTQDMEERYGEELYKEYLENENKQLKEDIEKLQFENKQLNDKVTNYSFKLSRCSSEETLQERINKAIDYIDKQKRHEYRNGRDNEMYLELNERELDELLKLLEGEYNE